jgi:hypothetical protein
MSGKPKFNICSDAMTWRADEKRHVELKHLGEVDFGVTAGQHVTVVTQFLVCVVLSLSLPSRVVRVVRYCKSGWLFDYRNECRMPRRI